MVMVQVTKVFKLASQVLSLKRVKASSLEGVLSWIDEAGNVLG